MIGEPVVDLRPLDRALARADALPLAELAEDLTAAWQPDLGDDAANEWLTRPAILRRIAGLLADSIPADVDRVIVTGGGCQVLGAAVSLTTGLPFAAIESAEGPVFGTIHGGETVSVVSAVTPLAGDLDTRFARERLVVSGRQVVVDVSSDPRPDVRALFRVDSAGVIVPRKDADHD